MPARKGTQRASANTTALKSLATAIAGMSKPTAIMGEPMVGLRNASNYTIGLRSPFQDESDIQLAALRYETDEPLREIHDPNTTAQVSHKWWLQLRRDKGVSKGMLVRDDAVLSAGSTRAPDDDANALPVSAALNVITDPFHWIESREEAELKTAISSLTAEESLRRLLTAVNQRIEHERRQLSLRDDNADGGLEEKALRNLPWRYKVAEEIVLERLERDFYGKLSS